MIGLPMRKITAKLELRCLLKGGPLAAGGFHFHRKTRIAVTNGLTMRDGGPILTTAKPPQNHRNAPRRVIHRKPQNALYRKAFAVRGDPIPREGAKRWLK